MFYYCNVVLLQCRSVAIFQYVIVNCDPASTDVAAPTSNTYTVYASLLGHLTLPGQQYLILHNVASSLSTDRPAVPSL